MLVIQENTDERYIEKYLEAFYEFYNKLYGYTRTTSISEFTMDPTRLSKKDLIDHNLMLTIDSINTINQNENIHLLSMKDDETEELKAFSRFRITEDELLIAEIICIKCSDEKKATIYEIFLNYLEKYAQSKGLKLSFVEIPFFDRILLETTTSLGYQFHKEYNGNVKNYSTFLVDKELTKERVDDYGRHLTNK